MTKKKIIITVLSLALITFAMFVLMANNRTSDTDIIYGLPNPHDAHSVSHLTDGGVALLGSLRHLHEETYSEEDEYGHENEEEEDEEEDDNTVSEVFLFSSEGILLDSLKDETNTGMGRSVVGFDNTILISFPEANDRSGFIGIYRVSSGKLEKTGEIRPSEDGNELDFGGSMDIAGDLLFIGADDRSVGDREEVGGVYVLDLNSGRELSIFSPDAVEEHEFGAKVLAHEDTGTLIVASEGIVSAVGGGGSVDIFSYSDAGTLTYLQHIPHPDNFAGLFAHSLVHTDDHLLIGSVSDLENVENEQLSGTHGRVYMYKRNGDLYKYVGYTQGTKHSGFGFEMKYDNETDEVLISSPAIHTIGVYTIVQDALRHQYNITANAIFFGHSFDIEGDRLASTALGIEIGDEKFVFCEKTITGRYGNCTEKK